MLVFCITPLHSLMHCFSTFMGLLPCAWDYQWMQYHWKAQSCYFQQVLDFLGLHKLFKSYDSLKKCWKNLLLATDCNFPAGLNSAVLNSTGCIYVFPGSISHFQVLVKKTICGRPFEVQNSWCAKQKLPWGSSHVKREPLLCHRKLTLGSTYLASQLTLHRPPSGAIRMQMFWWYDKIKLMVCPS